MSKTVVLIGDSIRLGYENGVRALLGDKATVISPKENGGTSSNVLAHLNEWMVAHQPDIVHLNCGLHDIKRPFDTQILQTPLEVYEENLHIILSRLQNETNAKIVFALTTPVSYARHHTNKDFDRYEEDVQKVNELARAVTGELDIPINDLYNVVMQAGRDDILLPDGVHYNLQGYALLAQQVAAVIQPLL